MSGNREIVSLFTAVFTVADIWLWRTKWIQKIPGVTSNLRGTGKGTLTSSWINKDGHQVAPKEAYLVIRQTATLVHAVLLTNESQSESSLADTILQRGLQYSSTCSLINLK